MDSIDVSPAYQDNLGINSWDGKDPFNVKHLTCWFWFNQGRCKWGPGCRYAHRDTGYYARMPQIRENGRSVAGRNALVENPTYRKWQGLSHTHLASSTSQGTLSRRRSRSPLRFGDDSKNQVYGLWLNQGHQHTDHTTMYELPVHAEGVPEQHSTRLEACRSRNVFCLPAVENSAHDPLMKSQTQSDSMSASNKPSNSAIWSSPQSAGPVKANSESTISLADRNDTDNRSINIDSVHRNQDISDGIKQSPSRDTLQNQRSQSPETQRLLGFETCCIEEPIPAASSLDLTRLLPTATAIVARRQIATSSLASDTPDSVRLPQPLSSQLPFTHLPDGDLPEVTKLSQDMASQIGPAEVNSRLVSLVDQLKAQLFRRQILLNQGRDLLVDVLRTLEGEGRNVMVTSGALKNSEPKLTNNCHLAKLYLHAAALNLAGKQYSCSLKNWLRACEANLEGIGES